MTANQQINNSLTKVMFMVIKELKSALISQGHKSTGNLIDSLEGRRVKLEGSTRLEILMEPYGIIMNDGRKPGKMVPIEPLIEWVKRKAIATGDKEAKAAAWAISMAIMREGIPTKGSQAMGKKTGFITDTMQKLGDDIEEALADGAELEIIDSFDEMVKRFNQAA